MNKKGGVFITVRDGDKKEIGEIAKKFDKMGFPLYATTGTASVLAKLGLTVKIVDKIHESPVNTITLLESGKLAYIISTSAKGRNPARDSVKIRRKAALLGIPCLTAIDTANALADSLMSRYTPYNTEIVDINNLKKEKVKLPFTKMSACSNDYIYINCFENEVSSPEFLSIYLSDRHNGVGGDGVIRGNGIRCVAKYLFDNGIVKKPVINIETKSGIKSCSIMTMNGKAYKITVDMGAAALRPEQVPVKLEGDMVVNKPVIIDGHEYYITCVSMGNPHCAVFAPSIDKLDLNAMGPKFEYNPLFPERVNVEFIEVVDERTLKVRVWERGSGETMACGTGACAAVVAATLNGKCEKGEDIRVILKGGDLTVRYTDEKVLMTGGAEKVFDGVVEV